MHVGETLRESDGLAMSSRNRYLSREERMIAPILYRALLKGKQQFDSGITDSQEILKSAADLIKTEKRVSIDYLSLSDSKTLEDLNQIDQVSGAIFSGAIRVGKTRIIDNVLLSCRL